jgi:hypothetical protein
VASDHGRGSADVYATTPEAIHDLACGELGYESQASTASGPYEGRALHRDRGERERVNAAARPRA